MRTATAPSRKSSPGTGDQLVGKHELNCWCSVGFIFFVGRFSTDRIRKSVAELHTGRTAVCSVRFADGYG